MELSALVAEISAHPLAQSTRPACSRLSDDPHVETNRCVDVPEAESSDGESNRDHPREEEGRIQIDGLLVDFRDAIRPPENVVLAEEDNNKQQHKSDGRERYVSLQEPNDRPRPARGLNPV